MTIIEREQLIRIAGIIGPGSAAAAALAELDRRRDRGEDAVAFSLPGQFVVGPPAPPLESK